MKKAERKMEIRNCKICQSHCRGEICPLCSPKPQTKRLAQELALMRKAKESGFASEKAFRDAELSMAWMPIAVVIGVLFVAALAWEILR